MEIQFFVCLHSKQQRFALFSLQGKQQGFAKVVDKNNNK